MKCSRASHMVAVACSALLTLCGVPLLAQTQDATGQVSAQDQGPQQQNGSAPTGWRKVGGPPTAAEQSNPADGGTDVATNTVSGQDLGNGVHVYDPNPQDNQQQPQRVYGSAVPAQLTIQPGTYITVRINQELSSNKNHAGDPFTATLEQPVVVNGVVVASPGQLVSGQVTEVEKSGRIEGLARLGVQLTGMTLVDGQQIPIQSQFVSKVAAGSKGRDAAAIAGTTGLGAAIGGIAAGGAGAAIGAGAGVVASTIGVLVTRGHASVIGPEEVLTFRITAPVTISTASAPEAFRYVNPRDYDRYARESQQQTIQIQRAEHPPVVYEPSPYPVWYPYYAWGYPYWGGIGFNYIYFGGHGWGGGRYYHGGGFHGGRR